MVSLYPTSGRPRAVDLPLDNEGVARHLDEIAELFEAKDSNPYRHRAYRRAAETIRQLLQPLDVLLDADGTKGLTDLPGIGDSIAHTIEQLVATGDSTLLQRLRGRARADAILTTVPGVGPKTAARIRTELGIETLADLELAAYD